MESAYPFPFLARLGSRERDRQLSKSRSLFSVKSRFLQNLLQTAPGGSVYLVALNLVITTALGFAELALAVA